MTASSLAARSGSATKWITAHNVVPSMSHNPSKHTLGIVGLGNIGFAIARKARRAFDMTILYTDLTRKSAQESEVDAIFYSEMTDMLPHCDCILLATPAGPSLLTASTIPLLPRGARVVNIARGNLIDEDALADALESGHLDAAGLDVHEHEPQVHARLRHMHNVELTSHTGGGSVETNIGFELLSMQNCEAVLDGRDPLTAVNMREQQPKKKTKEQQAGVSSSDDVVVNGQGEVDHHHGSASDKVDPVGPAVGVDKLPAGTQVGPGTSLRPFLPKETDGSTAPALASSSSCTPAVDSVADHHAIGNGNGNGNGNGVGNGNGNRIGNESHVY